MNFAPNCQLWIDPTKFQTNTGPGIPLPTAVLTGAGNAYVSGILPLQINNTFLGALVGYNAITFALTSSQNVTATVTYYLDPLGLIQAGAVASTSLTAATPGYVNAITVVPALYYQVSITNTSGTTANITNAGIVLMPNP